MAAGDGPQHQKLAAAQERLGAAMRAAAAGENNADELAAAQAELASAGEPFKLAGDHWPDPPLPPV